MIHIQILHQLHNGINKSRAQIRRFKNFRPVKGISDGFNMYEIISNQGIER